MGKLVSCLYLGAAIVLASYATPHLQDWMREKALEVEAQQRQDEELKVAFYKLKADYQKAQAAVDELVESIDRERNRRSSR